MLLDSEDAAYVDAGLKYLKQPEAGLLAGIEREPKLVRVPLAPPGKLLGVGQDEAAWTAMLS